MLQAVGLFLLFQGSYEIVFGALYVALLKVNYSNVLAQRGQIRVFLAVGFRDNENRPLVLLLGFLQLIC